MPQDNKKPNKTQSKGLEPLARAILGRLGMLGPVRAEETVDVTAKNPPMNFDFQEAWWTAPHRGKMLEILLGTKDKAPTGVHMSNEILESIKRDGGQRQFDLDTISKYPKINKAWQEMTEAHPYMTRFPRSIRIGEEYRGKGTQGSMRWDSFFGGPYITINPDLEKNNINDIKSTMAHELAHVGQQLNWPTYESAESGIFQKHKPYMERPSEQQAFDLGYEYDYRTGSRKNPDSVFPTNKDMYSFEIPKDYLQSLFSKLMPPKASK